MIAKFPQNFCKYLQKFWQCLNLIFGIYFREYQLKSKHQKNLCIYLHCTYFHKYLGHLAICPFCLEMYFALYLPTKLLCIKRIVIVIEEVNVKVFPSGSGWAWIVASSLFWQKCYFDICIVLQLWLQKMSLFA